MTININDDICAKHNTTRAEILVLGGIFFSNEIKNYNSMLERGLIRSVNYGSQELNKRFQLTKTGADLFNLVVMQSDTELAAKEDIIGTLAEKLREIYPQGRMCNSSSYYKGNLNDIKKRLESFFKKYGSTYTPEQIIAATTKYIENFNGNYTYLKLLKYFIWKAENKNGEVVLTSVLADYIENEGQEDSLSQNWGSELR